MVEAVVVEEAAEAAEAVVEDNMYNSVVGVEMVEQREMDNLVDC